jgi:hypothetical protein
VHPFKPPSSDNQLLSKNLCAEASHQSIGESTSCSNQAFSTLKISIAANWEKCDLHGGTRHRSFELMQI